jgi:antitoxin component YwqK of YwqJK toxin-antitoxin module
VKRVKPRGIPKAAKLQTSNGVTEYAIGDRVIARVYWHDNGSLDHELHFDDEGRLHGIERECFEDGSTKYLATWRHGRQHGLQQQWSERGVLLVSQRFVNGTGFDIWFDRNHVSETREYVDGDRHGFERWWADSTHVWSETHFARGLEHGIDRQWNDRGRLRRGFPRYWIAGTRVTRAAYLRAAKTDLTLPRTRASDDRPRRRLVITS